ncbi:acyl-CoA dehydrogenase family protein [Umezawaea endophytica]|uniref:Acyl-CoA dehydrogenase family protein n=1 Tax=Umezawaea endophytica TaxID=1654476 RepID=A0A9X2VQ14_9PSEU|nr:acyl-CoA dehydrogenase family protein [Umezawaea endophytica]MCS7480605.1 acyl-CoA dehydrogenase family protein [Umezawaea endophytica]
MRFALSAEQVQFGAALHDFLAAGRLDLAEIGVTALAVPERFGGLAADPVDLVVAFEELGHHAVAGPLVESVVVVPTLLADVGGDRWLPDLATGKTTASVVFPPHVPYAHEAELYFLLDGETLRTADPVKELASVDLERRLVEVVGGTALGTTTRAGRAFDLGVLACAAQLLGLGRAMLEMTTAHARHRTQFGRPIGGFQAVKHQLADVLIGLELARPLVHGAAVTLTSLDVSAAKVAAGDAAYRAARTALQVHGAIGYTAEHDLARWLTKTRALVGAWGGPSTHRDRVLEAL